MKIELEVSGMTCNNCKKHVEEALKGVSGVEKVEVLLQEGRASVEGSAQIEQLIAAVHEEGYTASLRG